MVSVMRFSKPLSMLLAAVMLGACASKGEEEANRGSELKLASELFAQTVKERDKAKDPNEPGMIRIERHTAGYTISMVMDATDDNIYFTMDLPEEEAEKQKQAEEQAKLEEEKAAEEEQKKLEETAAQENSPEKIAERNEIEAGKHVVYAQTYFFEKKYSRALAEINRAVEYSPNSAIAHSLKGSIHYKRNEVPAARDAWAKALELDPSMEDVKQMLEKVKK